MSDFKPISGLYPPPYLKKRRRVQVIVMSCKVSTSNVEPCSLVVACEHVSVIAACSIRASLAFFDKKVPTPTERGASSWTTHYFLCG